MKTIAILGLLFVGACGGEAPTMESSAAIACDATVGVIETPNITIWSESLQSSSVSCSGGMGLNLAPGGGAFDGVWNCSSLTASFTGKICGTIDAAGNATMAVETTPVGHGHPAGYTIPFSQATIAIVGKSFAGTIMLPDGPAPFAGTRSYP